MDHAQLNERISRISTLWSLVSTAHRGPAQAASDAQVRLLERYSGAIHRYLLGALRDPNAAEELAQEFALRFIRGDFQGVDPTKGRFRDYLKTVLYRMVANHWKRRNAGPRPLPYSVPDPVPAETAEDERDREFLESWRRDLLDRAWQALEEVERKKGLPYHTILRVRTDDPGVEIPSTQLAEELTARLGKRFTAEGVRKLLQRAREKFAESLLDDVIHSLDRPTAAQVEQELRELSLLGYCRPILERRSLER